MNKTHVASGFCVFCVLLLPLMAAGQALHNRDFWQGIAHNNYAVPEHASADLLAVELSSLLASPDPELRDDLAYSILARWIYRGVLSQPTLLALTDSWQANLTIGLGETGTNSVLKRSFSALCLASMARRDAVAPFMGAERYHHLVGAGIAYLQAERDLRGYDAALHWIHAAAHTADLLAGLALNSQLSSQEAAAILSAVSARLASAPQVFTQGEQDRLAAAVLAVIRRPDFDAAKFAPWLSDLQNEDRDVWTNTTPAALARYQNHTYLLQALFTRLAFEPDAARILDFRQQILAVMKGRMD